MAAGKGGGRVFKGIQAKLILILTLLILVAMQFIGVYLLQALEGYHIKNLAGQLDQQAQLISGLIRRYLADPSQVGRVEELVTSFSLPTGVEAMVLDVRGTVLCASGRRIALRGQRMSLPPVPAALSGQTGGGVMPDPESQTRCYQLALPVKADDRVVGVVYMIASLEQVYHTMSAVFLILLTATLIAMAITVLLAIALSRTITRPIREVTSRAAEMAAGDFDRRIEVRSGDELGQLAAMFNHLAARLKGTLDEVSSEKSKAQAILNHMADGIVALDHRGRIILVNPAAAGLLACAPDAVVGGTLADVPAFGPLIDPVAAVLGGAGGDQGERTVAIEAEDGKVLRADLAPVAEKAGAPGGLVIVLHDITEQERLERMRREFVANVSHELRTPLTTIKSYVETLVDGAAEDAEVRTRFLGVVWDETNRMVRLVNDLLQLSRLDAGHMDWEFASLDVAGLVADAHQRMAMQAERKGVRLEAGATPGLGPVWADRERMQQVLGNVIANALDFTPAGGSVRVFAAPAAPGRLAGGGPGVEITVKDTGVGIPVEDLPRLFERFYRVEKARTRQLGGTGLGLSIAREIIHAHGGEIDIASEVGRGTTVRLTLPVAQGGPPRPTGAGGNGQ